MSSTQSFRLLVMFCLPPKKKKKKEENGTNKN